MSARATSADVARRAGSRATVSYVLNDGPAIRSRPPRESRVPRPTTHPQPQRPAPAAAAGDPVVTRRCPLRRKMDTFAELAAQHLLCEPRSGNPLPRDHGGAPPPAPGDHHAPGRRGDLHSRHAAPVVMAVHLRTIGGGRPREQVERLAAGGAAWPISGWRRTCRSSAGAPRREVACAEAAAGAAAGGDADDDLPRVSWHRCGRCAAPMARPAWRSTRWPANDLGRGPAVASGPRASRPGSSP